VAWTDLGIVVELEESRVPPDVAFAPALDCQGLSIAVRPPLGEPS
jgi:hypothetical protein